MKLYWGPHTCAIGIHMLLEEIGKPFETEKLDVSGGSLRGGRGLDDCRLRFIYVERWAAPQGIALPINIAGHFTRMLARPAVHKVRALWGEG
jgi:hypothetical protein